MIVRSVTQGNGVTKYYFDITDSAGIVHHVGAVRILDGDDVVGRELQIQQNINVQKKRIEVDDALQSVKNGINPFPANQADFVYNTRAEVLQALLHELLSAPFSQELVNAAGLVGLVSSAELKAAGGYTDEQMIALSDKIAEVISIGTAIGQYSPFGGV